MDAVPPKSRTIYLIAGEASGDQLGSALMAAIHDKRPETQFFGVGGDRMATQGFQSLFPMSDISLMGIFEILPHILKIKKRINQTVKDVLLHQPDVLVTIDSPGFCHRVIQKLKAKGFEAPTIHYVAPTVWAWKPKRAEKLAKLVDHLMVLLPFEPPYFERHGLPTTFVGHPVVHMGLDQGRAGQFHKHHHIAANQKVILLMPGSRKGELKRHLPIFLEAARRLKRAHMDVSFVIPTLPDLVEELRTKVPGDMILLTDGAQKKDAYAAASQSSGLALVCSGTASVELAAAGVPQIVGYSMNGLTYKMLKRVIKTKYASLVNIIQDAEVVPELIQADFTPAKLSAAAEELLSDSLYRDAQKTAAAIALQKLSVDESRPAEKAADVVIDHFSYKPSKKSTKPKSKSQMRKLSKS